MDYRAITRLARAVARQGSVELARYEACRLRTELGLDFEPERFLQVVAGQKGWY